MEDRAYIQHEKKSEAKGLRYFDKIVEAIENKKVLRLYYLPFYEDKPYFNEVHPYLLKEHAGRWYLVGKNEFKGQTRTYALDRIRDLQHADDRVYEEAAFRVEEYFKNSIGIFAPDGPPPLVKMAVQPTQAQYLITGPWHESQNIEEENEDEIIFSFRVHPSYEFKSLVLGLGKDARIIEPVRLKEELKNELELMLKLYKP